MLRGVLQRAICQSAEDILIIQPDSLFENEFFAAVDRFAAAKAIHDFRMIGFGQLHALIASRLYGFLANEGRKFR